MKKVTLSILAIALLAPVTVSAATLPVNMTSVGPDRPLVLVGDGQEERHWHDYPGASHDVPWGLGNRFDLSTTAPRTGFALQPSASALQAFDSQAYRSGSHRAPGGGIVGHSRSDR